MGLEIVESALESRTVRKAIGSRVISSLQTSEKKDDKGNFLGRILNFATSALGFFWSKVAGFLGRAINWSSLWGAVVGAARFVLTFDFNITDAALDLQSKQYEQAIFAQLGGTIGNALGYLVCGVAPGIALLTVNEALGALVLKNVGEEFLDELAGNISALAQTTFRALAQKTFAASFKNTRRWLKKPNNYVAQLIFGDRYAEVMNTWGAPGSKPFVIAQKIEDWIEKIPNENLRAAVEEGVEEFVDACVEAGYVVANTVDGFMAAQKLQQSNLLGEKRIIEIQPNRESEEKILLAGPEELLKPLVVQTLSQHQLIENRDMGQFIGASEAEIQKAKPHTQKLKIVMYPLQAPPYGKSKRVTINIPDVPRSKMDWEKIKVAVGGSNGYMWGRFRAQAELDNGRQAVVWGATETEAEQRLAAVLSLSEANFYTINVTEEKKAGTRATNEDLQKEPTRVYPGWVTVEVNRVRVGATAGGRVHSDGKRRKKFSKRFALYSATKPNKWEEDIAELFRGDTNAD